MPMPALLGGLLVLAAVALLSIGLLGWRGALPRNRFVGVRTPASLRSHQAYRLANRVAAPALVAGGVVCLLGGGLALGGADGAALAVVAAVSGLGAVILVGAGGLLGHRAAAALPATAPAGCGGCSCCQTCGA